MPPHRRPVHTGRTRPLGVPIAVLAALCLLLGPSAGAATIARAPRAGSLHVAISVPSVLYSNGRQAWVANTGKSAVLELSAKTGRELLDVAGTKFHLDNSDSICQYGNDVWVANASSDTVTEFDAKSGSLKHVLRGPAFHFDVPSTIVIAKDHVFVLATSRDRVTEVNEKTAHLVRYLGGARYHLHGAVAMTRVGTDVWIASTASGGSLTELSAATGGVLRVVTAHTAHLDGPVAIATDGHSLFVSNAHGGHLSVLSGAGAYLRSITSTRLNLNRVTSLAAMEGRLWIASTWTREPFVAGLFAASGAPFRIYPRAYGYPAVFGDAHHVWVVDRLQSRVSELSGTTGHVLRIVSR